MIIYTNTNLFLSPAQTLVNTVNVVGVMGKGIAKDFKHYYPRMFLHYKEMCNEKKLAVGKLMLSKGEPVLYRKKPTGKQRHRWVLNFPTKQHWRAKSKMEYLESGLQKFVNTYQAHGIESVSFPQLGVGNGGLKWEDVNNLMVHYLREVDIPVYIHLYKKDTDHYSKMESQAQIEKNLNTASNEWRQSTYLQKEGFTTSKGANPDGIVLPDSPMFSAAAKLTNTKSFSILDNNGKLQKAIWLQKDSCAEHQTKKHQDEAQFEQLSLKL